MRTWITRGILFCGLIAAGMAYGELVVLAGWGAGYDHEELGDQPATVLAEDMDGYFRWNAGSGAAPSQRNWGSTDGTWGTFPGAPTSANQSTSVRDTTQMDFVLINNSSLSYQLASFHFDAWRSYGGGVPQFEVRVVEGGPVSAGVVAVVDLDIQGRLPESGVKFQDVDLSLSDLPSRVLGPGESVTFRVTGLEGNVSLLDNVAIVAIPEPATLGLLSVSVVVAFGVRFRRSR